MNKTRGCQCQSEFLLWLVITITISESTKAYKSKNRTIIICQGRLCGKENVFRCRRKIGKDGDDCTSGGREFHAMAAATGYDRRPTVDNSRKDGTYTVGMMLMSEVGDTNQLV